MRRNTIIALTIVIIATSYGEFIVKTKVAKGAIQRNIYNGKEASALQCAHRCKFLSTTAMIYKDELELCSCVEMDEHKRDGDLTEVNSVKNYKSINVELNRPSVQISTYPRYNLPNDAKYANDGDPDSRSVTNEHTGGAWWRVNLGAIYRIRLIKLFLNEYSVRKNFYGNIKIETRQSENGQWIVCDLFKTPHKLILETSCQTPTWGSIVKVVSLKSLTLKEVEVYA